MDLGLQEQFNRLEAQRQRAVSAAAALPETDRVLAMPGSAWSPAQVLTHCVMAEQEFLRRMASTAESGTGGLTPTRSPLFHDPGRRRIVGIGGSWMGFGPQRPARVA
jgi:uncharacterized damage-inducible protein DinB